MMQTMGKSFWLPSTGRSLAVFMPIMSVVTCLRRGLRFELFSQDMQVDRNGKIASFQLNTTHYSRLKDASSNMSRSIDTINMTSSRVLGSGEEAYNFEVTLRDDQGVHADARKSRLWSNHLNKGAPPMITEEAAPDNSIIPPKSMMISIAVALSVSLVAWVIVYCSTVSPSRPVLRSSSCDAREPGETVRRFIPDCFVTYWIANSKCPNRPWNPTDVGGSDGVQLASVTDGVVNRVPTTGACSHGASWAYGSKEWAQLKSEMIHVVNYNFDKQPSAEEVNRYKEQYGLKAVELGVPGWGGYLLSVRSIFTKFHDKPPETKDNAKENA